MEGVRHESKMTYMMFVASISEDSTLLEDIGSLSDL